MDPIRGTNDRPARLSSYAILSEPLAGGGFALLNGLSGAVDVVSSDLARMLLDALVRTDHREITVVPGSFHPETEREFLERGHLTSLSHEEERAQCAEVARILHDVERKNLRFLIVPNLDCNYRCTYCFERPLQRAFDAENSRNPGRHVLDPAQIETIFRCIDRLRAEAGQAGPTKIILYGGEPLDSGCREAVFSIVGKGRDRGFTFAAITNGHDLPDFLPLVGRDGIDQIQITFDGPPDVHNRRRISKRGDESFDRLRRNIPLVLGRPGVQLQLRVHLDRSTVGRFEDLLDIVESEGWIGRDDVIIYASPIYVKDGEGRVAADLDGEAIEKDLAGLTDPFRNVLIGAASANIRMMLWNSLKESKPYRLRGNYCSANTGMVIFAPDGRLYACWESLGRDESCLGRFAPPDTLAFDSSIRENWFSRCVADIPECLECPYALVCGGGCSQYALTNTGSLLQPFCDHYFKIFPSALGKGVESFLGALQAAGRDLTGERGGDFCL